MNKKLFALTAVVFIAAAAVASAASKYVSTSRLSLGGRYHPDRALIKDWPYADGDVSYGLFYAFYDGLGYLEFGVEYMPKSSDDDSYVDYVVNPRLNIALKDGLFVAAIGISCPYAAYADNAFVLKEDGSAEKKESDWTDLMYQLHVGLEIPVGSFVVDGGAYYSFEDWDSMSDFDAKDLEYGIRFGFMF